LGPYGIKREEWPAVVMEVIVALFVAVITPGNTDVCCNKEEDDEEDDDDDNADNSSVRLKTCIII
jgi:hypothetical protein